MEAAVLSNKTATKNGKILLLLEDIEVQGLRSPMTDQEFEEFCFDNPKLRIEQDKHGNIIIMSPVSYDSGNYESEVTGDLVLWNRKTKMGKTFSPSTMFILPDGEKRMPDAAWISMDKHKKLARWERKKFAHIVPDFIVEVRSPSDNLKTLKSKISEVWIANGVRLAWLLDPENETAIVFRPNSEPVEIKGFDQVLSGGDVLPGFEFDLSILKEQ
ncbi:MAG: Uma2 family endonuclease [Lewinellaceae bacterium]|nr:Uma2 family endonuclease [Saprospiraceae bacterium]MCB9341832.1 Uma2 family endonuclease [Lewinellaceae bacterium]